ncbi:kinetochore component rough deal [Arctopsyche grandis]|uniref:kinetochore component rough deal n=1 Tax=Arctopsyche grandis TaxID=121162 RepID=UPI00406D9083
MEGWNFLDKQQHADEYRPILCSSEISSNFSITVSAVFENQSKCTSPTSIKSCIQLPHICIYFGDVLLVLNGEKCELKLFKAFQTDIEHVLILKQSNITIVILADGRVLSLDLKSGVHCFINATVPTGNTAIAFMYEQCDKSIILVNKKGMLYQHLLLSPDGKQYKLSQINHEELNAESKFYIGLRLANMKPLYKSSLCLNTSINDTVNVYCPITKQNYAIGDSVFSLTPFENSNKVLFMRDSRRKLCIGSCYDLSVELSVDVGENCFIVGGFDDFALYSESKDGRIYVYLIRENSPMSQLEILISLKNYEAAELFAKTHGLSPTAVMEIKAKCLMNDLKQTYNTESFKELNSILSACENVEFVVECCIEGVESNVELSPLLRFAKKLLLNMENSRLNTKVDELLWKVETFNMFDVDKDNLIDWRSFIASKPMNICEKFLNNDLLDHAAIVWLKCYRFVYKNLRVDDVTRLLTCISLDTKLNSLLRFLEYFIPSVVNVIPHCADCIISWAKDRICILENSPHWPEVGVQFAEKFAHLTFTAKGSIDFIPPSADNIYFLISCMKKIQTLKKEYNIIVSLKDFTTLSANELAKLILRKAFNEDLQTLLRNFLGTFMIHHNLNHDGIIREYIEELLDLSPTIDEIKMLTLIDSIYNADEKYQCVILILKSAQVPWSETVRKMADDAIASRHILAPQIHAEILHADIRSILVKYECNEIASEDYECLIKLIINTGHPEMMSDIEKITNVYFSLKEDAYLLCIQRYVERSDIFAALNIYKSSNDAFKELCYNTLLLVLEDKLSSDHDKTSECNYIDFLRCIRTDDHILDCLNRIYVLKNRFQLRITLNEYCVKEYRTYHLNQWCKNRSKESKNIVDILSETIEVGANLSISKSDSILVLIDGIEAKLLPTLASIVMSDRYYFTDCDVNSVDLIFKLISHVNLDDATILDNGLNCILNILADCSAKCMSYCVEVCGWLTSIYYAHDVTRELLSSWKLSDFYNPHIVTSVVPTWKELFTRNGADDYKRRRVNVCMCAGGQSCDGSTCLKASLNRFQMQQNDVNFLRIIGHRMSQCMADDLQIPSWMVDVNEAAVKTLIVKMLASEKSDHMFIACLMFSLSDSNEWLNDVLKGYGSSQKKINFAHHILKCREVYHHTNIPYKQAFEVYSQSSVEAKLESCGIVLKENQDGIQNVVSLLESIVNLKSFDVEVFQEYCSTANIDVDQALMCYLFLLLKSWNNNYEFTHYNFGKCKIVAEFDKRVTMQKCMNVVDRIKCKKDLVENLTTLFKNGEIHVLNLITVNLSLYCYEVYLFILELLKSVTGQDAFFREYLLLKFLQTYRRISRPKQGEIDEFSMKETFPKIGFYRLPFQCLMSANFWNKLKPEVTLDTYKQWLPIAGLLLLDEDVQVSRDMICSNAVKQSMTVEKTINENSNIKWSLHMKNNRLLKEAHECVQNITNLEWAGACFYYVFQGSAFGADQVAAADVCYQFAEHWAKIEPNNNVVRKMQMKHLLTSSAHILHKYNLGEDKLLSLCDSPHRLIEALYNHRSILTRYESSDINNAVNEIADKHNLNVAPIRMQILERILSVHVDGSDGSLQIEALMRACYILKATNIMSTALYLFRIGLSANDSVDNYNVPIRALQCLLSLVDGDLIEKVSNNTARDIWFKLWELYFINGLHLIGLEYLLPLFHENKTQAVQQMWHTKEHNKLTVSLIVKMMFVYDIRVNDTALDELCRSILKFNMVLDVKDFLLSAPIVYSPNYIGMWDHVLVAPFKRLDTPLIGQQKSDCYEAIKLMPACPVLASVDLSLVLNSSVRLGVTELAMMVLPHLPNADRPRARAKIGKMKKSTLQEMKLMKTKGILTTGLVISILKQAS